MAEAAPEGQTAKLGRDRTQATRDRRRPATLCPNMRETVNPKLVGIGCGVEEYVVGRRSNFGLVVWIMDIQPTPKAE